MSAGSPYLLHGLCTMAVYYSCGAVQMITPEIILYGQVATGRTPSKRASPALPTPGTQTQDIPQPGCCCMSRCNLTLSVLGGDSPMEPTPSLQDLGAFLTTCAAHTARGGQGHLVLRERTAPQSEVIRAILLEDSDHLLSDREFNAHSEVIRAIMLALQSTFAWSRVLQLHTAMENPYCSCKPTRVAVSSPSGRLERAAGPRPGPPSWPSAGAWPPAAATGPSPPRWPLKDTHTARGDHGPFDARDARCAAFRGD